MRIVFRALFVATALLFSSYAYSQNLSVYHPGILKETPKDIVTYLEKNGIKSYYSNENDGYHFNKKCLEELQKYNEGKRKFYPTKEVMEILSTIQHSVMYRYLHSDEKVKNNHKGLYCMIDVAVTLCPDMNLLSKTCSSDHEVGVLDFPDSFSGIFYHAVMCKVGNKKFRAHTLELLDEVEGEMEKIRKVSESNGKKTYVVSNETNFKTYVLVIAGNGEISSCKPANQECVTKWLNERHEKGNGHTDVEIRYNPKKICWEFCYRSGNIFKRIEGTRALHLEFPDGKPTYTLK